MKYTIYYRNTYQGAWVLSAFVDGNYISRQYMFYTKREATRLFKEEIANKFGGR